MGGCMMVGGGRYATAGMMQSVLPGRCDGRQVSLRVINTGAMVHELLVLALVANGVPGSRAFRWDGTVEETGSLGEASATCVWRGRRRDLPGLCGLGQPEPRHRAAFYANYGIALFAVLLLVRWWSARTHASTAAMVAAVWAPIGMLTVVVINQPIVAALRAGVGAATSRG